MKGLSARLSKEIPKIPYNPQDVNIPSDIPLAEKACLSLVYRNVRAAVLDIAQITEGETELGKRLIADGQTFLNIVRRMIDG